VLKIYPATHPLEASGIKNNDELETVRGVAAKILSDERSEEFIEAVATRRVQSLSFTQERFSLLLSFYGEKERRFPTQ
jgi:hypothetical protein